MNDRFHGSWLKIERAEEHIENLNAIIGGFLGTDFYRISVEQDVDGSNFVRFDVDASKFPRETCALVIGDALHNLRGALDLLYAQLVIAPPDAWTIFPISDTREKLVKRLAGLEDKKITKAFSQFILDRIKAYETGNEPLWLLHRLNDWDKHQLLIPVLQGMEFSELCFEDDEHRVIGPKRRFYWVPGSSIYRTQLDSAEGRKVTLKDKGRATLTILFDFEHTIRSQPIIPTLSRIAATVKEVINLVEVLGLG